MTESPTERKRRGAYRLIVTCISLSQKAVVRIRTATQKIQRSLLAYFLT